MLAWAGLHYAFAAVVGAVAVDLHVTPAWVALGTAFTMVAAGAAAPFVAMMLTRVSAPRGMAMGALVGGLGLAMLATATALPMLYLALAVVGIAQAATLYEAAFIVLVHWCEETDQRIRALRAVTLLGGFAGTLATPLCGYIAANHGWRLAVATWACVMVATAGVFARLPGDHRALAATPAAKAASRRVPPSWIACFALLAWAGTGVSTMLVLALESSGLSLAAAARLAGLAGVAQVLARLGHPWWAHRMAASGRLRLVLGAYALASVGITLSGGAAQMAWVLLFGAANGLVSIERPLIVAEHFGAPAYAYVSGRLARASFFARATAPGAVAWMAQTHSYAVAYSVAAGCMILAAAMAGIKPTARY